MKTTAIEKDTTCIGCSGLLDDRMRGFVLDGSGPYCSEECCIDELMNERDRLYDERHNVISLIEQYGGIDGAHHKQWAIDQIARMLVDDYRERANRSDRNPNELVGNDKKRGRNPAPREHEMGHGVRIIKWIASLFSSKKGRSSKGCCAVCRQPVTHAYPWWTGNPARGGKPVHEECLSWMH